MAKKSGGTGAAETPTRRLILSRITARGYMGIEDHAIDLGPGVNVIVGGNATGKTSHLEAIRSVLGMERTAPVRVAHLKADGTLESKPELEGLLVDVDRPAAYEARSRRIGASSVEVKVRDGEDWHVEGRAVEWLRDVIDMQGAQPALFLAAPDSEKQSAILEALDLPYDRAAALEAAGLVGFGLGDLPEGLHPLEELEKIEKAVRDSRAIEGSKKRQALDSAKRIEDGLPSEVPLPVDDELEATERDVEAIATEIGRIQGGALDAERSAVRAATVALEARTREIDLAYESKRTSSYATLEAKIAELREAFEKRKRELEAEVETDLDAEEAKGKADLEAARQAKELAIVEAGKSRREAEAAANVKADELATLKAKAAALHERKTKRESDAYFRKQIAADKADAARHAERWEKLTASIEALVLYKLRLVESNPIKGLALAVDPESGKISLSLDGVPLSQVNTGRLEELAVEVSLLRSAPPASGRPHLPIILLDGIEALDPAARRRLLKAVADRGVQVIAACVGEGPLRVLRGEEALS
jgi:recombinational DNA repair ATPase RecF